MTKVISLFSILDDLSDLGEGTLYYFPDYSQGQLYNAYGGSYFTPMLFISKDPDF